MRRNTGPDIPRYGLLALAILATACAPSAPKGAQRAGGGATSDVAIAAALKAPVKHRVELAIGGENPDGTHTLSYHVKSLESVAALPPGLVLNVVVAADTATVDVPRGENAGKKLSHTWPVKSLEVVSLKTGQGTLPITLKSMRPGHTRIVGYVQSATSYEITGAAAIDW